MPHIKFTDSTLKSLSAAKTTWFTDPSCKSSKAFSQNIGHTSVITTISAYCPISTERQAELIRKKT